MFFGFSLVVTVGVFSYLFSHVSPREVVTLLREADRRGVAMFLVLSLVMSLSRAWRYQVALGTAGCRAPWLALFLVVLVRNFFSDLLPARIGTLVYIYLVTTRLGIPFGAAASSFALSFLFDLLALAPMLAAAVLGAGLSAELPRGALLAGGAALAAVTGAVIWALPYGFHAVSWMLNRLVGVTRGRFVRWREAWRAAEEDIRRARQAGIYWRMLILSILVRIGKYGSLYVFLFALIGPRGYGFDRLSVWRVFLGLCAAELAVSLPISGIAGFGAYEGTWALVFQLLGFPADIAKLTSISHHLFTQVYGYSLGALALAALLLPVFRREPGHPLKPGPAPSAVRFYLQVALFCLLGGALVAAAYFAL